MKKNQHQGPFGLSYYRRLVGTTRRYGSCYLHAAAPGEYYHGEIRFTVTGYGRSLQSGGNKYKAYAHHPDGKPVSTKDLAKLTENHATV